MQNFVLAMEQCVASKNWHAALFVALSIPDICGRIDDPTSGSKKRYTAWFDRYVGPQYGRALSGNDCYALRCAYLHEGRDDISEQRAREVIEQFMFVATPPNVVAHRNRLNNKLQLDIEVFCKDIAQGVTDWLDASQADAAKKQALRDLIVIHVPDEEGGIDTPGLLRYRP